MGRDGCLFEVVVSPLDVSVSEGHHDIYDILKYKDLYLTLTLMLFLKKLEY